MEIPEKLKTLFKNSRLGVISTSKNNYVGGAVMYYSVDDDLNIYCNTKTESEKYKNIEDNNNVGFTIFDENEMLTLQIKGKAEIIKDVATITEVYTKLLKRTLESGHMPPLLKMELGMVALIKITPSYIRFGNFSYEPNLNSAYEIILNKKEI